MVDAAPSRPTCGLIAAADRFIEGNGEFVTAVEIDHDVDPAAVRDQGAVAMKLLVIHRPDEASASRVEMVEEFVDRCRAAGLVSIIEPVAKAPRRGGAWDWDDCVVEAREGARLPRRRPLQGRGPAQGPGPADEIRRAARRSPKRSRHRGSSSRPGCRRTSSRRPWSSPCREGASGFLAGRAVWAAVIGSDDVERDLDEVSIPRLQRLGELVDEVVQR